MRKLILILAIIGYTLTANAFDIKQFKEDISKPLKLDVPEMEAKLTDNGLRTYRQEMELRSLSAATKPATVPGIESNRFTWMRTNPGVKEYKVMDDLTFVGIPVFLAGWLAKSEKQAFRQNDGSRHVLLTEFKTHIDDYTQYFGPAMTVGLKVAGVEGRSDWGRLLGSAAMSYGIMAAFVGDECRGVTQFVADPNLRSTELTIYGRTAGESVTLKYYDAVKRVVYTFADPVKM